MFGKVFLYINCILFSVFITGCGLSGAFANVEHTLDTSLCNKGLNSYCANPGTNNIHSELINKKGKYDVFDGSASTTQKGYFQLSMACLGEPNNASLVYDNANARRLFACSEQSESNLQNPLKTKYCYYKDNKENYFGVLGDYIPVNGACVYRYYSENEILDELFEHQNDPVAVNYIQRLFVIDKLEEEDIIRLGVLQLPSIKRDESRALQNLKNACVNAKRFYHIRYVAKNMQSICNDFEFAKDINKMLCSRYKFKPSCDALRSLR